MALTTKQKLIINKGLGLNKDRSDEESKSFLDILMDTLNAQAKADLFAAVKAELVRRRNVRKDRIEAEIVDLEKEEE